MAVRVDLARMSTVTGGASTLTFTSVAGYPTFTQALGSGSTPDVHYILRGANCFEKGVGTWDGSSLTLSSRTPSKTWNGSEYGTTTPLTLPITAVFLYCALSEDDVEAIESDIEDLQSSVADLTTAVAGKAATSHAHAASDITSGVFDIARIATGTPTGSKFVRDDGTLQTIPGGGDALVANPLSQFASTTSAQLRGVLSDETGTGSAVFATSPTLVTPNLGVPSALDLSTAIPKIHAINALTWAADRLAYFTSSSAAALATFTSFGRTLVALVDGDALKTLLGYTTAAPSGTGDMPVYTGSVTEFRTPAQVRTNLAVTNQVRIPWSAVPENGTFSWVLSLSGTGTFNSLSHKGTGITLAVKLNSTAITGLSAITPTGTKTSTSATAANVWADGDELNITFSGASSPSELALTLFGTRLT